MHADPGPGDVPAAAPRPSYLPDRRELEFMLWEMFDIEHGLLGEPPFERADRAGVSALLDKADGHSARLAAAYAESDRDPARRIDDDHVHIPASYQALWREHVRDWFWMRQQAAFDGASPQQPAGSADAPARVPPLVAQAVVEMFFGANPAFMPYSGFTPAAAGLLRQHGTAAQCARLLEPLDRAEWDACLCATERDAGSDLSAVRTRARRPATGDDDPDAAWAIEGEKILISAGMHPLTANTLYLVLARVEGTRSGPLSLSCFIVPRLWPEADGRLVHNHVACAEVHEKMGLNGCANTRLVFGSHGTCRGWLLGGRANVALLQLQGLMGRARVETGIFGVALASSAYLHALAHARRRVQGSTFDKSANPWAPKVAIIRHHDVQRMLLQMKSTVEGCRLLVARVASWASHLQRLQAAGPQAGGAVAAGRDRLVRLIALFSPVVKAHVSEEAWHVVSQAVQVHGSAAYLRDCPLEQYLRDIKVLTLWEGTTYIQAQDLVRDKLAFGRKSAVWADFTDDVRSTLAEAERWPSLAAEAAVLGDALQALGTALARLGTLAETGRLLMLSQFCTRFLGCFGDVAVGWNLLAAAVVAERRLQADPEAGGERGYYLGKQKAMRYYMRNVLPRVAMHAELIVQAEHCHVEVEADEFTGSPLEGVS